MNEVKSILNSRASEVERYFAFISSFTLTNEDDELNKILKSNLLLMLYNLIESSLSNAIEEIHNQIYRNGANFDELKKELKSKLLKYLKKDINPEKFLESINFLSIDMVKFCYDKKKLFSGNIDHKLVKELSSEYGFNYDTDYEKTKHGSCLVTIKGKRNDLAHGVYSFSEVGKDYTLEDLEKMKDETISYLHEIVQNIERYLNEKEYLV